MSTPDIIRPLTADANGPQAWVWMDCISIDRNGGKPLVAGQVEDKWRVSYVNRASLVVGGNVVLREDKTEVEIPSPLPSASHDLADYRHHPRVAALIDEFRDVMLDIATGEIQPAKPEKIQE